MKSEKVGAAPPFNWLKILCALKRMHKDCRFVLHRVIYAGTQKIYAIVVKGDNLYGTIDAQEFADLRAIPPNKR